MNICVTSKAKSKIRAYVKNEQRQRAFELGKEMLEKTFRKFGANIGKYENKPEFQKYLKDNGCPNSEELYIRVGYGKITPKFVAEALIPKEAQSKESEDESQNFLQKAFKAAVGRKKKSSSLIQVDGMSDVLVRFARCCNPIPGDPIMGFITLGRGIVIHRADCPKSYEFDQDRRIDVDWNVSKDNEKVGRLVRVRVVSQDNQGLLKAMTEVFSSMNINIHNAQIRTTKEDKAISIFDLNVRDTRHLSQLIENLQKIKGIIGVTRITKS